MVTFEMFLAGLMIVSALTSLVTEAIKKLLSEHNAKPKSNTLAGVVSVVLSLFTGIGYAIITSAGFSAQLVVMIIALMFLSWLCSMVGYDKVLGIFNKTNK